jgi:hypothetical protein
MSFNMMDDAVGAISRGRTRTAHREGDGGRPFT